MKVALAVQVISTSVADALQYLYKTEQNGYDFSEMLPTVTFLRNMDSLFAVLNSRNLHNKGSWNNNPNVKLFQAKFEKILVRCGVQPGKTGNVSLLDSSDLTTPPLANSEIVMSEALFADDQSFCLNMITVQISTLTINTQLNRLFHT
nr:THAP domain-containing 6-like protein [Biomphalaria glabrata]